MHLNTNFLQETTPLYSYKDVNPSIGNTYMHICATNMNVPKYIKQLLAYLKGEVDSDKIKINFIKK